MSQAQQIQALLECLKPEQRQAYSRATQEQKQMILSRLMQQQANRPILYRVFKPEIDSVAPDPLDPVKRYHDGVWVEHDRESGNGKLFHVTGDIIAANGMRYEEREDWTPGQSGRLHRKIDLGYISKADYDAGRVSEILRRLQTPTRQQGINFWEKDPRTGRHELMWCKENGDPYKPGEQRRRIFKCNEWTDQLAIPALRNAGILRTSV